jgi:hypothetical protein
MVRRIIPTAERTVTRGGDKKPLTKETRLENGPTSTASERQGVAAGAPQKGRSSMKQFIRSGVDLGKRYFQIHALESEDGRAVTRKLPRSKFLEFRGRGAVPDRHGGLRLGALLGAPDSRDGARRSADAAGLRQAICQALQERRGRRGGLLRSRVAARHALRANQERGATAGHMTASRQPVHSVEKKPLANRGRPHMTAGFENL